MRIQRMAKLPEEQRNLATEFEDRTGRAAGRIGFYLANFGETASKTLKRQDEHAQMHRNPASIIIICECTAYTFQVLFGRRDQTESEAAVADEGFKARKAYNYSQGRSCGRRVQSSLLIGVRDTNGCAIEYVHFKKLLHKEEKLKGKKKRRYSRAMVARLELDDCLEHLSKNSNVMAVRVHNKLANLGYGAKKLEEF